MHVHQERLNAERGHAQYVAGSDAGRPTRQSVGSTAGQQHVPGRLQPLSKLELRRIQARRQGTTFCYDFPSLFSAALQSAWQAHTAAGGKPAPAPASDLCAVQELTLAGDSSFADADAQLQPAQHAPGGNSCSVVVWRFTMRTPEQPQGRQIIVVANDITLSAGSFGPKEYAVFRAACDHAVAQRLPLVYLAANSGARVGLDQKLKDALQVSLSCAGCAHPVIGLCTSSCAHSCARPRTPCWVLCSRPRSAKAGLSSCPSARALINYAPH